MARPREFDHRDVLEAASRVFREHGFSDASIEHLSEATGVRRGSLYNAFGDKRGLYLEALDAYADVVVAAFRQQLENEDGMAGVASVLRMVAARACEPDGRQGCLLPKAALELGARDGEVQDRVRARFDEIAATFEGVFAAGRSIDPVAGPSPIALAGVVVTLVQGLRVMGAAGLSRDELMNVADAAATLLRHQQTGGAPR